ncbi:hypothetical protein [Sandaracinobacteroides hominis]|uniref:hypothetical protein n=1 Tax=Sandaracinobacteroides hominis TaxID=2780086 RepID=UPI0018F38391|nr:hypothetical protein [Sandaracinobacteroides hominis]
MTRAVLAALLLTAAGCTATKEMQVRSALTDAGMPPATAQCMAQPMARDLSTDQLRSMSRVAKALRDSGRTYSQRELIDILRRDLDPETVAVVVRAGVGCFLRG